MSTRNVLGLLKVALAGSFLVAGAAGAEQRQPTAYTGFDGETVEVVERFGAAWNSDAYFERSAADVTVGLREELRRMLASRGSPQPSN